jgi:hypothetical protein
MMKKVKWEISTEIFRRPGLPQIPDALIRAGTDFFECEYNRDTRKYERSDYTIDDCVVMYGPIRFVRENNKGYLPGAFGFKNDTNTSHYMSQLPRHHFFNSDAIYLPFGMIDERKNMLGEIFGDHLFIRPDSGFKSFTGFDVKLDDLSFELNSLKQTSHPGTHEMCLISRAKPIHGEYRIVICEKRVVTGSQYRWDGKMDVRIDVHSDAWEFAEKAVAQADWQLDTCYVVDIFLSDAGPKIGEFNSFSSSGLYNCDLDSIVEAVNVAAIKEWEM